MDTLTSCQLMVRILLMAISAVLSHLVHPVQ